MASLIQVTGTQGGINTALRPLRHPGEDESSRTQQGQITLTRGLARLHASATDWIGNTIKTLLLLAASASQVSALQTTRFVCCLTDFRAPRMHTCTCGNVYVMSARAYAEDESVSLRRSGLGRLAPLLSCCLNDFLTVRGAMYPAVPPLHINTPSWPKRGKGQRRACGRDPSDNSAKVWLPPLPVIGEGHKVRQQAGTLRHTDADALQLLHPAHSPTGFGLVCR